MHPSLENVKCPECNGPMVSRKSQHGIFWGCKAYPKCKGTRDNEGRSKVDRDYEKLDKSTDRTGEEDTPLDY